MVDRPITAWHASTHVAMAASPPNAVSGSTGYLYYSYLYAGRSGVGRGGWRVAGFACLAGAANLGSLAGSHGQIWEFLVQVC